MKFLKFVGLCLCGGSVICSLLLSLQFLVCWNLLYLFISSVIFFISLGIIVYSLENILEDIPIKRK